MSKIKHLLLLSLLIILLGGIWPIGIANASQGFMVVYPLTYDGHVWSSGPEYAEVHTSITGISDYTHTSLTVGQKSNWATLYTGSEEESFHASVFAGDGRLIKFRTADPDNFSSVFYQRNTMSSPVWASWTELSGVSVKSIAASSYGNIVDIFGVTASGAIYRNYSENYGISWEGWYDTDLVTVPNSIISAARKDGSEWKVVSEAIWWDSNWDYRQKISFTDLSELSGSIYEVPVQIRLNGTNFDFEKADSGAADIRFVDADNQTSLPYWIEMWSAGNEVANFWVNIPELKNSDTNFIWLYYGNKNAYETTNRSDTYRDSIILEHIFNEGWHGGSIAYLYDVTSYLNHGEAKLASFSDSDTGKALSLSGSSGQEIRFPRYDSEELELSGWGDYNKTHIVRFLPDPDELDIDYAIFSYGTSLDTTFFAGVDGGGLFGYLPRSLSNISTGLSPNKNEWNSLSVVMNEVDRNIVFYLNGDSYTYDLELNEEVWFTGGNFHLGGNSAYYGSSDIPNFSEYEGLFDSYRIYDFALSEDEINGVYLQTPRVLPLAGNIKEDFEWGGQYPEDIDSGNSPHLTWTKTALDGSKAQIKTTYSVSGEKSLALSRITSDVFAYAAVTAFDHREFSFYWLKDDASGLSFSHGNGIKRILVQVNDSERLQYVDTGGIKDTDIQIDVSIEDWFQIEIKNINWIAGTYDLFYDGSRMQTGVGMLADSLYENEIAFSNYVGSDSEACVDDFHIIDFSIRLYADAEEDFEWGGQYPEDIDSGNSPHLTWTKTALDDSGHISRARTTTSYSFSGDKSLALLRATSDVFAYAAVTAFENSAFSFYWLKDGASGISFSHGNGIKRILVQVNDSERLQYVDTGGIKDTDTQIDVSIEDWFQIEIKNINWIAGTYDIWHDGTKVQTGAGMLVDSLYKNEIAFSNYAGSYSEAFVDDFHIIDSLIRFYEVIPLGIGEDFEWGATLEDIDSGNSPHLTWTKSLEGTSTAKLSNITAVSGDNSLRLFRGIDSDSYVSAIVISSETQGFSFHWRKDGASNIAFAHGNGIKRILVRVNDSERLQYDDGFGHRDTSTEVDVSIEDWFQIEIKNVNWIAGTYDIWHDDTKVQTGAGMASSSSYSNEIAFLNYEGHNSEFFIDDFYVINFSSFFLLGSEGERESTAGSSGNQIFLPSEFEIVSGLSMIFQEDYNIIVTGSRYGMESIFALVYGAGGRVSLDVMQDFGTLALSGNFRNPSLIYVTPSKEFRLLYIEDGPVGKLWITHSLSESFPAVNWRIPYEFTYGSGFYVHGLEWMYDGSSEFVYMGSASRQYRADITAPYGGTYYIYRGVIHFDTTNLSAETQISKATLSLYGRFDHSETNFDLCVVPGNIVHSPLIGSDFGLLQTKTLILGYTNVTNFSTEGYFHIELNQDGLDEIIRKGVTIFALRSSRDISSVAPTGDEYVSIFSRESERSKQPKLTLSYTRSAVGVPTDLSVDSARIFSGVFKENDQLIVIEYKCIYVDVDNEPMADPKEHFALQLLDPSGRILAQSKLALWGYSPGSIYLHSEESIPIEEGYQIRLIGHSSYFLNPEDDPALFALYQIQREDFKGKEHGHLDRYLMDIADSIEEEYLASGRHLTMVPGTVKVFTGLGTAIFETGIPGLRSARPHLFETIQHTLGWEITEWDPERFEQERYKDNFGVEIMATFTALGANWGLDGPFLAAGFWAFIMLMVAGVATMASGQSAVGLIVSLPLLYVGVYLGAIEIAFAALLGFACAAYLLHNLILSRT